MSRNYCTVISVISVGYRNSEWYRNQCMQFYIITLISANSDCYGISEQFINSECVFSEIVSSLQIVSSLEIVSSRNLLRSQLPSKYVQKFMLNVFRDFIILYFASFSRKTRFCVFENASFLRSTYESLCCMYSGTSKKCFAEIVSSLQIVSSLELVSMFGISEQCFPELVSSLQIVSILTICRNYCTY